MNHKMLSLKAITAITLSGFLLVACDDTRVRISADTGHGHSGPRAHGGYLTHTPHRHRVSFDAALGMYIVLGLANTYWNDGHYYRYDNRTWHRSSDNRRWRRMQHTHIPPRLQKRHKRRVTTYHNNKRVKIVRPRRSHSNVNWIY